MANLSTFPASFFNMILCHRYDKTTLLILYSRQRLVSCVTAVSQLNPPDYLTSGILLERHPVAAARSLVFTPDEARAAPRA